MTRFSFCAIGVATLSLWGCAQTPIIRTRTVTVDVPVYVSLPDYLTTPVQAPSASQIATNGDLADYALQCKASLKVANGKLSAIRKAQPSKPEDMP